MSVVHNGIPGMTERLRGSIYEHVFAHPETEVGGVLVGTRQVDGLAVVRAFIPALEAEGDLVSLTFTHDAWQTIHAKMDRLYPAYEIVGWYHSHPGHGIFLSDHDMFIHRNFFANRSDIAYVIDPQQGLEGAFIWRGDTVVNCYEGPTDRPGVGTRPSGRRVIDEDATRATTNRVWQGAHRAPPGSSYPLLGYLLPGIIGVMLGLLLALMLSRDDAPAPVATPSTPAATATAEAADDAGPAVEEKLEEEAAERSESTDSPDDPAAYDRCVEKGEETEATCRSWYLSKDGP